LLWSLLAYLLRFFQSARSADIGMMEESARYARPVPVEVSTATLAPTTWLTLVLLFIGNMCIAQLLPGKYLILLHILETPLIPRGPSSQRQRLGIAIAFSFFPFLHFSFQDAEISFWFFPGFVSELVVGGVWRGHRATEGIRRKSGMRALSK
jgi:hypothetical protein